MEPILPVSTGGNLSWLGSAKPSSEAERLRDTARELEGVFLGLLMKAMRTTVGTGGLFKDDMATQTYRDMFDQEIGRSMARAGGIGLAQMVLRDQLRRQLQEPSAPPLEAAPALQAREKAWEGTRRGTSEASATPAEKTSQVLLADDR